MQKVMPQNALRFIQNEGHNRSGSLDMHELGSPSPPFAFVSQ